MGFKLVLVRSSKSNGRGSVWRGGRREVRMKAQRKPLAGAWPLVKSQRAVSHWNSHDCSVGILKSSVEHTPLWDLFNVTSEDVVDDP